MEREITKIAADGDEMQFQNNFLTFDTKSSSRRSDVNQGDFIFHRDGAVHHLTPLNLTVAFKEIMERDKTIEHVHHFP